MNHLLRRIGVSAVLITLASAASAGTLAELVSKPADSLTVGLIALRAKLGAMDNRNIGGDDEWHSASYVPPNTDFRVLKVGPDGAVLMSKNVTRAKHGSSDSSAMFCKLAANALRLRDQLAELGSPTEKLSAAFLSASESARLDVNPAEPVLLAKLAQVDKSLLVAADANVVWARDKNGVPSWGERSTCIGPLGDGEIKVLKTTPYDLRTP